MRGVDYTDWRLPLSLQPDPSCSFQNIQLPGFSGGYSCTGSEMGHVYFQELGGVAAGPTPGFGPFTNANRAAGQYWTGTDYSLDTSRAVFIAMTQGFQNVSDKAANEYAAWAVRGGDVGVVPAPAAVWLLGTGLAGLGGRRWLRRKIST